MFCNGPRFDLDGNAGINFFTSLSSVVNFEGNLDVYAAVGATYNMNLDVQDTNGVAHQVALDTDKKPLPGNGRFPRQLPALPLLEMPDLTAISQRCHRF